MTAGTAPALDDRRGPGRALGAAALSVLACTVGYFALAMLAITLSRQPGGLAAVWTANAWTVCWLLAAPARRVPALLAGTFVAGCLANLVYGDSTAIAAALMSVNLLDIALAAGLLRVLRLPARELFCPRCFAWRLFVAGVLPSMVTAPLAALWVAPMLSAPPLDLGVGWWISSVIGALTVLPLGLLLVQLRSLAPLRLPLRYGAAVVLAVAAVAAAMVSLPQPFLYVSLALGLLAVTTSLAATALGVALASLAISVVWAVGLYDASGGGDAWQELLLHLPHGFALVPALLLAAARHDAAAERARFQALFDHAPEGILLLDESDRVVAQNPAAMRLFGPVAPEASLAEAVCTAPSAEAGLAALGRHPELRLRGVQAQGADGAPKVVDISAASYTLPSGTRAAHLFVVDSTRQAAAEAAMQEASERLSVLSAMVPGTLAQFDLAPDGAMTMPWTSLTVESVFGFDAESLRRSAAPVIERIAASDRPRVLEALRQSAETFSDFVQEFAYEVPGEPLRWISVHSRPGLLPDGTVRWHGHVLDVTDRRAAEEQRMRQQTQLQLAMEAGGIGVWENNLRTGANLVNERWLALLGYRRDEFASTIEAFDALVHPEDRPRVQERRQIAAAQGSAPPPPPTTPTPLVLRLRHKDGSYRWVDSRARVIERDEQGRPVRMVGTAMDITERIEAERVRADRDRAEAADRAKTAFLSRMSHELRTPLNSVLGYAELLATDPEGPQAGRPREHLRQIQGAAEHLLALINDVLDLARIENGDLPLRDEVVDGAALCEGVLAAMRPAAEAAGVSLQNGSPGGALLARADAVRLKQVLLNLLSNAVKYNRPGGSVTLSARVEREEAVFAVQDTGLGMSPEQTRHLFEPFNRLGAEATGIEGTGIGLTICKQLIERMGGTLGVVSRLGQGSCFEVRLVRASGDAAGETSPLRAPTGVAPPRPASVGGTASSDAEGLDVLYVEDNEVNIALVQGMSARRPDVRLHVARSGAEARRALAGVPARLVLVDMNLGDCHGTELLQDLRAVPGGEARWFVALSADALPEQIAQALSLGFHRYLTKPLAMKALFGLFDECRQAHPPDPAVADAV